MATNLQLFPGAEERLDVSQERAKLLAAQREHVLQKTAVLRREYAPIGALERVLAAAVQAVCDRLDQLPGQLRAECADLPQAAIDRLMTTIAAARADWAQTVLQIDEERADAAE